LRLEVHTGLAGSIVPVTGLRAGSPWLLTTAVPVVDGLTDDAPRSTERDARRV
jgi:hypothetical protein